MPEEQMAIDCQSVAHLAIHAQQQEVSEEGEQPVQKKTKRDDSADRDIVRAIPPFVEELIAGTVERDPGREVPADALSLEVVDEGRGHMHDLPVDLPHPVGPVRLLEKEEVAFVEHPHRVDSALPDQEAGADRRFDFDGRRVTAPFTWESPREEVLEQRCIGHERKERGKGSDGILPAPVGVEKLPAGNCDIGVSFQIGEQFGYGAFGEECVGIEQKGVAALHDPQSLVVGRPESPVLVVLDQVYGREPFPQHGRTAVGGGVVDDDHLVGQVLKCRLDGFQAPPEELPCVPSNYDD